ncbi:MAG: hypothetical protein BIFFINMI_03191 [Phycisphaerae bacterium]|nr:hypothetical protein [Phycisphaerae bacterium]
MLLDSLRTLNDAAETFLNGVRRRIEEHAGGVFGGHVATVTRTDQSPRFKERLANAGVFDHDLLMRAPANPMLRCDMSLRVLGVAGRRRGRLAAVVALDGQELIRQSRAQRDGDDPGPWARLSGEGLAEALRSFRDPPRRAFVGVCSPSGFSDEAIERAHLLAAPLVERGGGMVLVSPRPGGGWRLHLLEHDRQPWHFLFDPEPEDDKIRRIHAAVADARLDVTAGGLVDVELARELDVEVGLVRAAFATEAGRNPLLQVQRVEANFVLVGLPALAFSVPARSHSMFDRLRSLFGLQGSEQRKIETLASRQADLTARRKLLYDHVDGLIAQEAELKQRGVAADSDASRRRIAGELAQVRRRIEQGNTLLGLFNRQIDVLSTHIHNLTLVSQGRKIDLPDVEAMTADAVRAEELLERVKADADSVESLSESASVPMASRMEDAIMAELKGEAAAAQAPGEPSAQPEKASPEQPQKRKDRDRPMAE